MTAPIGSLNSISGTASTAVDPLTAGAGGAMGKNQFIKLLIAQMTHQDPLAPQDGAQMASQLAQFSSVEQLQNINSTLSAQANSNASLVNAINNSSTLALIGKNIEVSDPQIDVGGTTPTSAAALNVPNGGGNLTMRITDMNGNTLSSQNMGSVTAGKHSYSLTTLTSGLAPGTYKVAFDFKDGTGAITNPTPLITTRVDGIQFGTNGAVITSGTRTFSAGTVVQVFAN